MNNVMFLIEILGTIAFALSGALTALNKRMDMFGVCILGITTAVGGGAIRDIILGITPPRMFMHPIYVIISVIVSVIAFFLYRYLNNLSPKRSKIYNMVLLWVDSIGLGTFTVSGIITAININSDNGAFLLVFVGVVTGVGGGVLRDLFAGNIPYIFQKHIYACASTVGAIIMVILLNFAPQNICSVISIALIILIRLLSAHYKLNLPKYTKKVYNG